VKVGLQIPSFTWQGGPRELRGTLARIARRADQGGFASLWVMDHFFQIPPVGPAEQEMLEGYAALGFLAGVTERVTLGTLVTGVTYRHPGLLVKTVSSLDVLSGGRAVLGIGAAWFEREHRGLGVPFPPLAERFERLAETLEIAHQMWSGRVAGFEGRHYRLAETLDVPGPLRRPHPPILIGGGGERKTLRLVARHADACNLFTWEGVPVVRRKLDVLRRHCDAEQRDPGEIEITTLSTANLEKQSPAELIGFCRELADAGVQHAIFNMPGVDSLAPLDAFAETIIPEVAGF
jgi:F420-dependent oxidoreductase-like protein